MERLNVKKELRFPDGFYHCVVDKPTLKEVVINVYEFDYMEIACKVDALRNTGFLGRIILNIPYIPAARQDRICNVGEPLSARVVADAINNLQCDEVWTFTPHSDVISALVRNLHVRELHDVVSPTLVRENLSDTLDSVAFQKLPQKICIVSPDAGAMKRAGKYLNAWKNEFPIDELSMVCVEKVRDVSTGEITKIQVNGDIDETARFVVVDDVCAMGGTFHGVFDALKNKGAKDIYLVLGHVDKRNGVSSLSQKFNSIFTTNSQKFLEGVDCSARLTNIILANVFA